MQVNFFDDGSPYLTHPLLTGERTELECDFATQVLQLGAGTSVLDMGCAFGRHSVALARRGFHVTGVDPSVAMLAAADKAAGAANVSISFVQSAGETFTSKTQFDAAICLFTTLGQIGTNGDNVGLLNAVHATLVDGGRFLIEVPQREVAVANLRAHDRFGAGERYTDVRRVFDSAENHISEQFDLVSPEGTRQFGLRYRVFNSAELTQLLQAANFTVLNRYCDYHGNPLQPDSPTMLFLCQK